NSLASLLKWAIAGFSSTVVAVCRYSGLGIWQKYGVSNNSWIRMICEPLAAAWRTSCSALAILAWRAQLQLIWRAAAGTRRRMGVSGKLDTGYSITHDHAEDRKWRRNDPPPRPFTLETLHPGRSPPPAGV